MALLQSVSVNWAKHYFRQIRKVELSWQNISRLATQLAFPFIIYSNCFCHCFSPCKLILCHTICIVTHACFVSYPENFAAALCLGLSCLYIQKNEGLLKPCRWASQVDEQKGRELSARSHAAKYSLLLQIIKVFLTELRLSGSREMWRQCFFLLLICFAYIYYTGISIKCCAPNNKLKHAYWAETILWAFKGATRGSLESK